jgi:argininosuccinate lyase
MPFRDAHHVSGSAVKAAEAKGLPLKDLPLSDYQAIEPKIDDRVFSVLSARASMESRTSYGGTAPIRVMEQAKAWQEHFEFELDLYASGDDGETA